MKKIDSKVDYPLTDLDISKYVLSNNKNKFLKYDLFAVINHYGTLVFGHYTAFCKNSIDNKWYEFNDSSINEIKIKNAVMKNDDNKNNENLNFFNNNNEYYENILIFNIKIKFYYYYFILKKKFIFYKYFFF